MQVRSFRPARKLPKIAIYLDAGVSTNAFQQLILGLKEPFLADYTLELVSRHFFRKPDWEKDLSLLVFPGGRDVPYHKALQGEGNASIRSYVENGGRFLGICAGGYYGAASIAFAEGEKEEIIAERELAFFPGKAVGPAYRNNFQYDSEVGALVAPIRWQEGISPVYFYGGCFFLEAHRYPSVHILGSYSDLPDEPAAVVYCSIGEGAALLSGVHPEYSPKDPLWGYLINKILT